MVTIRLARGGRTHQPLYTIIATDSRSARNGKFLERMGSYNPAEEAGKTLSNVKADRIAAWVKNGATMSDTVKTLLKRNNIVLK
tara:strand:- start:1874 stop:2125 length:252 start_codon:yes stop_codon:yes gene_type:complete